MDASSYLKRHGWRGDGHSLDHTGQGIKKPLLVSHKVDVLGVGLGKHTALSDQWWLKAFDSALKDMGTGKQSTLSHVQKHGVKRGDLYGRFVKGGGMAGTIGDGGSTGTPVPEATLAPAPEATVATAPEDTVAKAVGSGKRKGGDDARGESPKAARLDHDGVDRRFKHVIKEAVRCGIIPPSAKEVEKGVVAGSGTLKRDGELSKIVAATGFQSHEPSDDVTKQKEARRAFKSAVKIYLSNESAGREDKPNGSVPGLSSAKLAHYTRRAQKKGVSLETYVQRRNEKNASKPAGSPASLAFVIDTTGDPTLASRKTTSVPAHFSKRAIDGISAGELTVITNEAGDELFRWHPGMPIPRDPRIWEGVEVKKLPKVMREARRAWMVERREARKEKRGREQKRKSGKQTDKTKRKKK